MIILKDYQQRALDRLMEIYRNPKPDTIPLFIAPTGAGKTIMSGSLVNQISTEDTSACFIWISIGKSGLHEQSKYKIEKFFPKVQAYSVDDIVSMGKQELESGEILFLNWEAVTSKSKKDGKWLNVFMRPGENVTLPSLVQNTRSLGRKIVLLVDEAHSKSASLRGNEIIKLISPSIIFNITATPRKKQYTDAKSCIVKISSKEVIDEGVIKKSVIVNKGIRVKNNIITDLLDTANLRREQLQKLYKAEGSNVNPLCIIQVPNGNSGVAITEEVKLYLEKLGKTEENGKVAIWTSEDKINLESLEKIDSPQEYLIFKQAIDTGWDCPRAQILVKYRDIQSEVFKEQIIGRILRMPELKHYKNQILNSAYIFTNEENFEVDKPEELPEDLVTMTESIPLKEEFTNAMMFTVIPSFSYIKLNTILNKRGLMLDFARYIHDHMDFFKKRYNTRKGETSLKIPIDLVYNTVDGLVESSKSRDVQVTPTILKGFISLSLKRIISDEKIRNGVIDYLLNKRPEDMELKDYLELIVINLDFIMSKLDDLVQIHNSSPTVRLEDLPIVYNGLPPTLSVAEQPYDNPMFKKFLYMWFPYKSISKDDQCIIEELESDDSVQWWFYNRTFSYVLGIPCIMGENVTMYKPRFIVYKNNKLVIIDYSKDGTNYRGIKKMLDLWVYKSKMPNLELDLRLLVQNNNITNIDISGLS